MKKYNILQGTADWFETRHGKITGTASKGLFVKSDTLLNEILSMHIEDWEDEDSYTSAAMDRGNDLEPVARLELETELFISFEQLGFIQSETNALLGISPDGLSKCDTMACEIKCPGSKKHTATILANDIPSDNIHQCLHYFTVNSKLEKLYFASFRPENKVKPLWWKMITRDSEIDLGTKAKPVVKTVAEWVEIARDEAAMISVNLDIALNKLNEMYGK